MEFQRPGVSLGQLLDNMLQKTYHDLTVLAELLPRKLGMERKIEIVKFATRTRKQFARLNALVKWASASRCIDQCQEITAYLEKQSMLLASTADQLHHLAKGTLVAARLPNFALPVAVDVLATGTYPRLPACLKDKIIPDCPLSPSTDKDTKDALEAIICQRLVANDLPDELFDFSIGDGRVTFTVKDEFEVALTVISSAFTLPWRLLSLKILVKDPKQPKDTLVLPHQVDYLLRLAQSQLFIPESPLQEMYNCLHWFCVSLQLEVLHSQARHFMDDNPRHSAHITAYKPGSELVFEYWAPAAPSAMPSTQLTSNEKTQSGDCCLLQVVVENAKTEAAAGPACLGIVHTPSLPTVDLGSGDCHRFQPLALNMGHLSMEAQLQHAIEVRTMARLYKLYTYLRQFPLYCDRTHLGRDRTHLDTDSLQLLVEFSDEGSDGPTLNIFVDSQSGVFSARLLPSDPANLLDSLEIASWLNKPSFTTDLMKQLDRLRARLVLSQCKRLLRANVYARLPMAPVPTPALAKLGPDHIFIKLAWHPLCFLVIEVLSTQSVVAGSLDIKCHLLQTGAVSFAMQSNSNTTNTSGNGADQQDAQKPGFLTAMLSPLDASLYIGERIDDSPCLVHGPRRKVPKLMEEGIEAAHLRVGEASVRPRRMLPCINWIELLMDLTGHLVEYSTLLTQLSANNFSHSHIRVDPEAGICVYITKFPTANNVSPEAAAALAESLVGCQVIAPLPKSQYITIFMFAGCPLQSLARNEQGSVRRIVHPIPQQQQTPTTYLVSLWTTMAYWYSSVLELSAYLDDPECETFRQCCVVSFNYTRVILAYGPGFRFFVSFAFFRGLKLEFGMLPEGLRQLAVSTRPSGSFPADCSEAQAVQRNPHTLLLDGLVHRLFSTRSFPLLIQGLHHSLPPLLAVSRIVSAPVLSPGVASMVPQKHFTIIARSATSFLLIYRGMYRIEVQMKMDGVLQLKDCGHVVAASESKGPAFTQSVLHLKDFLLLFLATHGGNRSNGTGVGYDAPGGKFVVGGSVSGLYTPVPLTPTVDMQGDHASAIPSSAVAGGGQVPTPGGSAVLDDMPSVDVDALMRDLHAGAGGTPGSSTDSPRPPASVGEATACLDDINATTPGGTSLMDMFSPSFVDSSPGNIAAPSPATIKAITGVKPISVNSPASTLQWGMGSADADFASHATGGDGVLDVGSYDSNWGLQPWAIGDPNSDPSMLMDTGAADPLSGTLQPAPRAANYVLSPPPLNLPTVAAPTVGGESQAQLTSQVSVSYANRRPSIAVTVAEPTPSVSTFEERISPPDAVAGVLTRQKGAEPGSTWYASSPVLITHHCWFELLRQRAVSYSSSPFAAVAQKMESQDSGIGSQPSTDSGSLDGHPSFQLCPLEGFLASMYMFQHWHGVVQEPSLGLGEIAFQPLKATVESANGLQCRVWLDLQWPYMLQSALEVSANIPKGVTYRPDDLRAMEKFFLLQVSRPPYRHNALMSYARFLAQRKEVLEDLVQLLHASQKPEVDFLWKPELCLVVPPCATGHCGVPGEPAITTKKSLCICVSLTALPGNSWHGDGDPALKGIVVPLTLDAGMQKAVHVAGPTPTSTPAPTPEPGSEQSISHVVRQTMAGWSGTDDGNSTKLPFSSAVRYLCSNLTLDSPSECSAGEVLL